MGKKLFIIGLVVLVLVIGGVVILFLSLNRVIRSAVETYGPQATKSEVKLGSVNVSPFSGQASLSNLVVGNPQGFKAPSAFKLGGMRVALEVRSLLSDTVAIHDIVIRAPRSRMSWDPVATTWRSCRRTWRRTAAEGSRAALQPRRPSRAGKKSSSTAFGWNRASSI